MPRISVAPRIGRRSVTVRGKGEVSPLSAHNQTLFNDSQVIYSHIAGNLD